jgi:hypothetical protein
MPRPRLPGTSIARAALMLALLATAVPVAAPAVAQEGAPVWELVAAEGPGPRWDHTLAWDEAGGRLVAFGGRGAAGAPLGDTWLFDLEARTWETLDGPAPSPRFGHAIAVDQEERALYLFGGQADGATFFDDAWRLDLATGTWTDVSPAPETRPLKRCLHEAVWDEANGRMLLFGGCSSGFGPCPQGDLWAFDPAARTWTELTPASSPAARSNPALVVDPARERAVLVGGLTADGYAADAWTLPMAEGAGWEPLATAGEAPTPRASHDAVVAGDRLYLLGGSGDAGTTGDLWALALGG